ncbi:hypothetical protein FAVG1_06783 [Fusarium avenaceum]|nr:hypothetical protein FAVG1_06783 [Fusarium avenaceum]
MAPRPFLSLPCELRHRIYKEYFALHGGYVFQPGSGKLADADGQPLDLALMSTCSLIASETKELPFKYNSITFTTVYHPEWRAWAGRFGCLLNHQIQQRHGLVIYLGRFLTPEITSQIKAAFPWFVPVLEDAHFKPWDIPAMSDLKDCGYRYYDHRIWKNMHHWHIGEKAQYEYRYKYRFSATSVAIRFLKHQPLDKRLFIRNVVIREDRVAVGHPSSHVLGLIPFCKENVRLKNDLQVDMLDNIFQRTYLACHHDASCVEAFASHDLGEQAFEAAIGGIFCEVKEWLNEALCLIDAGMPAGSFTLTLDGENAIDLCSDIFQRVVLKELAMQKALERVFPRRPGQLREDWFGSGWRVPTVGIEHLVNQTSFLRSNFHPGIIPNVDKIVADRLGYDEEKWRENLTPSPWYDFSPSVHVPRLGALAMENFERRTCSRETKAQRRRDRRYVHGSKSSRANWLPWDL